MRLAAPGRVSIAPCLVKTAVSSTKVESGYRSSASKHVSVRPQCSSASQYAACCSSARAKLGAPSLTVVKASVKFKPGGRTIALVTIVFELQIRRFNLEAQQNMFVFWPHRGETFIV